MTSFKDYWGVHSIPDSMGVYMIHNTSSGGFYIGSSDNMRQRFRTHISNLRCERHTCLAFQEDWDCSEPQQFAFKVLEHVLNYNVLREREMSWMLKYGIPHNPKAYNTTLAVKPSRSYTAELESLRIALDAPVAPSRAINLSLEAKSVLTEIARRCEQNIGETLESIILMAGQSLLENAE